LRLNDLFKIIKIELLKRMNEEEANVLTFLFLDMILTYEFVKYKQNYTAVSLKEFKDAVLKGTTDIVMKNDKEQIEKIINSAQNKYLNSKFSIVERNEEDLSLAQKSLDISNWGVLTEFYI